MHAVIIGSGLVGAATALALKQVGIEATLYDQVDLFQAAIAAKGAPVAVEFGESGGSVLIASIGLRVLRTLGLLDEVMASSYPSPTTNWFKIDGSSPITLNASKVAKDCGENEEVFQTSVQILRSKLHSIMMQACNRAGIRCFTGKKFVCYSEMESGVTVEFEDGTTAAGDFLVGADGIHSATRRAIFGDSSKAEFTGAIGHIGVVRTKEHNITLKETCAFYLEREKKQTAWTFKISDDLAAVQVMTFNDPKPSEGNDYRPVADLPKESSRLADMMAEWGVPKHVEEMMRRSFRISPAAIYDLPDLSTYHKGRVILSETLLTERFRMQVSVYDWS
ncbi:FAD/NAD(P)-binding domain-containing protein [Rhizoclosmatium globosum]|uniref:FAD/NAD(P)-binding domain-containing protein n=1 Tax=Rhizoclosmatium globosum TaxID=329046 RepID=A0A1Y2CFB9_9FUNG|nr:FAD/NAD(P)-binding domain-containing protein [Rhizoclosmatium globosum]|eukprot:ORY45504.1 FAD/NAD(P)-binding domain-containing protein [Rhizoclosmatium globosum]